jgi:hypothetical protein
LLSKATRHAHVKMLGAVATSRIQDVRDEIDDVLEKGLEPDSATWLRISAAQDRALMGVVEAAQAAADSLRLERDQARAEAKSLHDELGDRRAKNQQRAEAAAMVAAGAVSVQVAGENAGRRYVFASVRDDGRIFQVGKRADEPYWTCECDPSGMSCKHIRGVQLCCFPCEATSVASRDPKAFAAAGAVTVKLQEEQRGFVEVIDGGKTYNVSRTGFGGFRCSCGTPNADCVHGEAAMFVTRRP